jgi:hypothetical protein
VNQIRGKTSMMVIKFTLTSIAWDEHNSSVRILNRGLFLSLDAE